MTPTVEFYISILFVNLIAHDVRNLWPKNEPSECSLSIAQLDVRKPPDFQSSTFLIPG